MNLSKEEKALLDSVESGEWETIPDVKKERKRYQAIAKTKTIKVSTYAPPGHGKIARNAEELQTAIQTRDETE